MFEEYFYPLRKLSKEIMQEWINVNAKLGSWTIYGYPMLEEREAKQLCGRLLAFKKGVKVKKFGKLFAVMFWEPS